jgi:hypothetical protein
MRTPWGIPSRREQAGEQADQKRAGDIDEQLILMNSVPQGNFGPSSRPKPMLTSGPPIRATAGRDG